MPVSCTAQSLAAAAVDFDRLSDRELMVVIAYEMGQLASPTLNAKQILAAAVSAGYPALDDYSLLICLVYLLCLADGGT